MSIGPVVLTYINTKEKMPSSHEMYTIYKHETINKTMDKYYKCDIICRNTPISSTRSKIVQISALWYIL